MRFFGRFIPFAVAALVMSRAFAGAGESARPTPPDAVALADAVRQVREALARDYADRSPAGRKALCDKLIDQAAQPDNPTVGFALLSEARDVAVEAGDATNAIRSVDLLTAAYEIPLKSSLEMKITALGRVEKTHGTNDAIPLGQACLSLGEQAMRAGDVDLAARAASLAFTVGQKARDTSLVARARAQSSLIKEWRAEETNATKAAKRLEAAPDEPNANLVVGKWLCYYKGDWATGLPHLAKGADPVLAAIAAAERTDAPDADARVRRGDTWWDFAAKHKDVLRALANRRAAYWYNSALADLTGLTKARVESRLEGLAIDADEAAEGGWISKHAKYTVGPATNGGFPQRQGFLTGEGDFHGTDPGDGFAFIARGDKPNVVIDLGRPCQIVGFEIVNRKVKRFQDRTKTLTIWLAASPDGPWAQVWSADGTAQAQWTIGLKQPVSGRYVKIGLRDNQELALYSAKVFGTAK